MAKELLGTAGKRRTWQRNCGPPRGNAMELHRADLQSNGKAKKNTAADWQRAASTSKGKVKRRDDTQRQSADEHGLAKERQIFALKGNGSELL